LRDSVQWLKQVDVMSSPHMEMSDGFVEARPPLARADEVIE